MNNCWSRGMIKFALINIIENKHYIKYAKKLLVIVLKLNGNNFNDFIGENKESFD